jgi:hypothetical protein
MAAATDQRDGVTAVTATRYPPARRKRRKERGRHGRARRGAVGVRRHAVTAVIRCAVWRNWLWFLPVCLGLLSSQLGAV